MQKRFLQFCLVGAFVLQFLFYSTLPLCAQLSRTLTPSDTLNNIRLSSVTLLGSAAYGASVYGMYTLWYSGFGPEPFHFFNDNDEWLYMDKVGHLYSAYALSSRGIDVMQWTGMDHKKAILIGGLYGYLYQTSIEVFDGFSPDWGFSWGDIVANTIGTSLAMFQELQYGKQKFLVKWSFRETEFAKYRPELLGKNFNQQMFKDYNGQSYWISVPLHELFHSETRFPKWLCISGGIGAEGMLGGVGNPEKNEEGEELPHFERRQQYYFSLDIDLTAIPTQSRLLKTVFNLVNVLKVPMPALEYNRTDHFKFHSLYY
ncbi:MAG TPA: DUF2279 domain-containing protein [Bacteroidia bacterium]|nr:DUF2279 domain-containing protein [Bacteroidia bacterium]